MQDKKMYFSTINYPSKGRGGREIEGPSLTVPDQVMSMREIFKRFANGLPISGTNQEPLYMGDDIQFNPKKLDLTELDALRKENDSLMQEFDRKQKEKDQEALEKKLKEKFYLEFEQEQKAKNPPPAPITT